MGCAGRAANVAVVLLLFTGTHACGSCRSPAPGTAEEDASAVAGDRDAAAPSPDGAAWTDAGVRPDASIQGPPDGAVPVDAGVGLDATSHGSDAAAGDAGPGLDASVTPVPDAGHPVDSGATPPSDAATHVPNPDAPPPIGEITVGGAAGGGYCPRKVFWQQDPGFANPATQESSRKSNALSMSAGRHPMMGCMRWTDAYANSVDGGGYSDQPAMLAWHDWLAPRQQLWARWSDGTVFAANRSDIDVAYVSPAMPLDPGDVLPGMTDTTYADFLATRLSQHALNHGLRGLSVADYHDSLPYGDADSLDFNIRVMDHFEQRAGVDVPGGTVAERSSSINSHYRAPWRDFWGDAFADFWAGTLSRIKAGSGEDTAFLMQVAFPATVARSKGVDLRRMQERMSGSASKRCINVELQGDEGRAFKEVSTMVSRLGMFAAWEPDMHTGAIMNLPPSLPVVYVATDAFWRGVDAWLRRQDIAGDGVRLTDIELLDSNNGDLTDSANGIPSAQGGPAANAFDHNRSTFWEDRALQSPEVRASWIQYQFPGGQARTLTSYSVQGNGYRSCLNPRDWQLLGSNDNGGTWNVLDERSGESFGHVERRVFPLAVPATFNTFRLNITSITKPMPERARLSMGMKLLKAAWLAVGYVHVANRDGSIRRALTYVQRYYSDARQVPAELWEQFHGIIPRAPWGVAGYYSVPLQRVLEAAGREETFSAEMDGRGLKRILPGYWVSDAALAQLPPANRPTAWVVADAAALPADERTRLEATAPVHDVKAWDTVPSPVVFSALGAEGDLVTGYAFVDQHGRVILVATRTGNTTAGDIEAQAMFTLPPTHDGTYQAAELLPAGSPYLLSSGTHFTFTIAGGSGVLSFPMSMGDTRVLVTNLPQSTSTRP